MVHFYESSSLTLFKVASDMEAEKAKVQELQNFRLQLSKQLAEAKTTEIEQRRNFMNISDELDALKKKYTREVMDLEMDKTRLEREVRELKEELRISVEDLCRERDVVSVLKVCFFFHRNLPKRSVYLLSWLEHGLSTSNISIIIPNTDYRPSNY